MLPVLAHQGGWDEMLFVAVPLGLFAFLLYMANRRAQHDLDDEDEELEQDDRVD